MNDKREIDDVKSDNEVKGTVEYTIEHKDGRKEEKVIKNTVLRTGKNTLAKMLANEVNDPFDFYIDRMQFGTNGTVSGVPRYVEDSRNGLFGPAVLAQNVISSIDTNSPNTAIFTAVIGFDEAVGSTLNEMALEMADGNLFSMVTFPDLGKTADIQIVWNWKITNL